MRQQHPGLVVAIARHLAIGNAGKGTPFRKPWHDIFSPWQTNPIPDGMFRQCWPAFFQLSPFWSDSTNFCPPCFFVYPSICHYQAVLAHIVITFHLVRTCSWGTIEQWEEPYTSKFPRTLP